MDAKMIHPNLKCPNCSNSDTDTLTILFPMIDEDVYKPKCTIRCSRCERTFTMRGIVVSVKYRWENDLDGQYVFDDVIEPKNLPNKFKFGNKCNFCGNREYARPVKTDNGRFMLNHDDKGVVFYKGNLGLINCYCSKCKKSWTKKED